MPHLIYLAALALVVALAVYQISNYLSKKKSVSIVPRNVPVAPVEPVAPILEVTNGVVTAFLNSIESLEPQDKIAQISAKIDDLKSLAIAMPHHASFANGVIEGLKAELAKI